MTGKQIAAHLLQSRHRRGFAIPNYTPRGWFECDVFEITKGGFFREYEVKVSRGDFVADARKAKKKLGLTRKDGRLAWSEVSRTSKHALMECRSECAPSYFWYATPEGLIQPEEIPEWAGLIWVKANRWGAFESLQKKAPRIHRKRLCRSVIDHAKSVLYYRYNRLWIDVNKFTGEQ